MCGFTCSMFGARYPDALCVEGYMWDLDSAGPGEDMTSGGDIPCPMCSTQSYLQRQAEHAAQDIPNPGAQSPAELWEETIRICLKLNRNQATQTLRNLMPFDALDWPGRIDTPERIDPELPDLVLRRWPWSVPGISHHAQISILPKEGS